MNNLIQWISKQQWNRWSSEKGKSLKLNQEENKSPNKSLTCIELEPVPKSSHLPRHPRLSVRWTWSNLPELDHFHLLRIISKDRKRECYTIRGEKLVEVWQENWTQRYVCATQPPILISRLKKSYKLTAQKNLPFKMCRADEQEIHGRNSSI